MDLPPNKHCYLVDQDDGWVFVVNTRKDLLQLEPAKMLIPGVSEIKRCELYLKFRDFVDEDQQDVLCPYPGAAAIERNKDNIKKRRAFRSNLKKVKEKIDVSPSTLSTTTVSTPPSSTDVASEEAQSTDLK